ncbi:hypothetical protein [Mesorhizobium sp. SARCC-RB16n]|uniref:hypothetical protein n=1 Tax=Mesorhizobium sp. SARCC-RB16n TaxID=2116687 RepID=UPI00166DF8F2|nr:hypothetical protein [Mesorhizobium sp. SARCC-RB16n]
MRARTATAASCCCFNRPILAVSRSATAIFTRDPPSSQRGTLVLATLPRAIAVREMSLALLPTALLSSVQLILSYLAGEAVPPIDEHPATRSTAARRTGADPVFEIKFISASGSPFTGSLIFIDQTNADAHFVKV